MVIAKTLKTCRFIPIFFACGLCFISVLLVSCGGSDKDKKQPITEQSDKNAVTAQDTASAKSVEIAANEPLKFRYNPSVGDVTRYKISQFSSMENNGIKAENQIEYFYTKKIKSVNADSVVLTLRIDSIRASNKVPNQSDGGKTTTTESYNSTDTNSRKNREFLQLNFLIGTEVYMIVSTKGAIMHVDSLRPIMEKLLAAGGGGAQLSEEDKKKIEYRMGVEAFVMPLQQEYQFFDEKAIDSSRSWVFSYESPLAGIFPMNNVITYKVSNVLQMKNRKVAEVSAVLNASILQKERSDKKTKVIIKRSNITGSGKHLFDFDKGFTVLKRDFMGMELELEVSDLETKQTKIDKVKSSTVISVELVQ